MHELARARTQTNDLVETRQRGRVIDGVHDVVERTGERVQILAVERRDERPVKPLNRVMRQRIAAML